MGGFRKTDNAREAIFTAAPAAGSMTNVPAQLGGAFGDALEANGVGRGQHSLPKNVSPRNLQIGRQQLQTPFGHSFSRSRSRYHAMPSLR